MHTKLVSITDGSEGKCVRLTERAKHPVNVSSYWPKVAQSQSLPQMNEATLHRTVTRHAS